MRLSTRVRRFSGFSKDCAAGQPRLPHIPPMIAGGAFTMHVHRGNRLLFTGAREKRVLQVSATCGRVSVLLFG
jgi:hypothetical protein